MSDEKDEKSIADKKRGEIRRIEIAMLGLLMEKYPRESREKVRKLPVEKPNDSAEKTFV